MANGCPAALRPFRPEAQAVARHGPQQVKGSMTRIWVSLGLLFAVFCVAAGVFWYSGVQSLEELRRRGQSDLEVASDRLVSGLFSFRQLAVALASDPRLDRLSATDADLADILRGAADFSGALEFALLDRDRKVLASASQVDHQDWPEQPFVSRAFNGALGRDVAISAEFGRRVFYYASPVFSRSGAVNRVVVAVIDLEAIEADFRGSRPAVFMTDQHGVIYFSNRSELVLTDRSAGDGIGGARAAPFVAFTPREVLGFDLWSVSAGRYLPSLALHLERDLPVIGMKAEALIDVKPAVFDAALQAAAASAVILLLGTVIAVVGRQRRVLAQANQQLERRVAERTRELSDANTSLRAEITERQGAEAALRRAQEDLIQAGKLSALGKMSAGISHELNQPLMAIQSFADNATTFIERDNTETAKTNLNKISALARRMGRIIQNFRAFARQEREKVHRVDLVGIVHGAVDIAELRIKEQGAVLRLDLPQVPVWVQGGEVRLQQVIVNLISNALDAMAGRDGPRIEITLSPGAPVRLSVRDTGPGIEQPDKVFEPFYSTKGFGEGVGLGLSISYGLVQSFGGNIRGQNDPGGGAIFTIELQPWDEEGGTP